MQTLPLPPDDLAYGEVRLRFIAAIDGDPVLGLVPYYHFHIFNNDSTHVGHINFRVGDTPHIEQAAGHIGYGIFTEHRGNGYASQACLALQPLIARHYDQVWITCDPGNHASRRTIENMGGIFIDQVDVPQDDPHFQRGSSVKRRYRWSVQAP